MKRDLVTFLLAFDQKVFEEGALSAKAKELIAIGGAPTASMGICRERKGPGATDGEIAEAIFVGTTMSVGAAVAHSCIAMDALKR